MGGISKTGVKIPRWLKRIEQAEYTRRPSWLSKLIRVKPAVDLDGALRESDRRLWADAGFFAIMGVGGLINVWLDIHGEQHGRLAFCTNFLPFVWLAFSDAIGSEDRWLGALVRRASNPGGVGREWVARQSSIRRRRRAMRIPREVLIVVILAVIPVTHGVYHPRPGVSRLHVELYVVAAAFLACAVLTAVVLRRVNRRCFETACAALFAAEAELAVGQTPGAGAGTVEDAEPSDAISWEIAG